MILGYMADEQSQIFQFKWDPKRHTEEGLKKRKEQNQYLWGRLTPENQKNVREYMKKYTGDRKTGRDDPKYSGKRVEGGINDEISQRVDAMQQGKRTLHAGSIIGRGLVNMAHDTNKDDYVTPDDNTAWAKMFMPTKDRLWEMEREEELLSMINHFHMQQQVETGRYQPLKSKGFVPSFQSKPIDKQSDDIAWARKWVEDQLQNNQKFRGQWLEDHRNDLPELGGSMNPKMHENYKKYLKLSGLKLDTEGELTPIPSVMGTGEGYKLYDRERQMTNEDMFTRSLSGKLVRKRGVNQK